jgi:hypothetical protein
MFDTRVSPFWASPALIPTDFIDTIDCGQSERMCRMSSRLWRRKAGNLLDVLFPSEEVKRLGRQEREA